MVEHIVKVRDRRLSVDPPRIVAGGSGADALALDLDAEWDGMAAFIVLDGGSRSLACAYGGEPVEFPDGLAEEAGYIGVSVLGIGPDGERMVTQAAPHALRVVSSGN